VTNPIPAELRSTWFLTTIAGLPAREIADASPFLAPRSRFECPPPIFFAADFQLLSIEPAADLSAVQQIYVSLLSCSWLSANTR
jgi:hypothetical protein